MLAEMLVSLLNRGKGNSLKLLIKLKHATQAREKRNPQNRGNKERVTNQKIVAS